VNVQPIGWVRSARIEPEEDGWDAVASTIALDASAYGPQTLRGLDEFSHIEVLFVFHLVDPNTVTSSTRHPRAQLDWPESGIFAQRNTDRPNRIGSTVCRLVHIEGVNLRVIGLDAVDGSPVLDIKPHVVEFGARGAVRQAPYTHEMLANYWQVG
jgi:tRNA-Thr(GGU) m(6)t(6)A37 methyltransferase TsaA